MKKPLLERFIIPLFISCLLVFGISLIDGEEVSNSPGVEVSFLDVGQGDAILFKTINSNYVLIDGGPDKSILTQLGSEMPLTKRDLEAVIISHPHADHVAGLNYVFDNYTVEKVYLTGVIHTAPDYVELLKKIKNKGIQAEKLYAPKEFEIDGLKFRAYWPKEDLSGKTVQDQNEFSIALTASYGDNSVLLLGDLPDTKQGQISKELPRSKIIKVAHQGAKDGVSKSLLGSVQPEYAVISVGENSYGHPTQKALNLLSAQKVKRTDILGTIRFLLNENSVNPL